jgi:hypothetical protein
MCRYTQVSSEDRFAIPSERVAVVTVPPRAQSRSVA